MLLAFFKERESVARHLVLKALCLIPLRPDLIHLGPTLTLFVVTSIL